MVEYFKSKLTIDSNQKEIFIIYNLKIFYITIF